MTMMVIDYGAKAFLHTCPVCLRSVSYAEKDVGDGVIIHYYSERHAYDAGWRATQDRLYCPPDVEYVWVCPKHAKELVD